MCVRRHRHLMVTLRLALERPPIKEGPKDLGDEVSCVQPCDGLARPVNIEVFVADIDLRKMSTQSSAGAAHVLSLVLSLTQRRSFLSILWLVSGIACFDI